MNKQIISRIVFAISLFVSIATFAQESVTITGKITASEDGSALPGVNILIKGTSEGTITDVDGNYTVDCAQGDILVFSYIGYLTEEVSVEAQKVIDLALVPDMANLEEVVVVGYGARKKTDITGSVSSVTADELNAFPVLDATQAIQGRAAGVVVQSNNGGEPGAPISIKIRGNTSINASSDPLIVVDGFVGAKMPQAGDIESMQILKDASATAIYGSRGANGVIMVTTKKGKSGKISVDLNSTFSVQSTTNRLDLLNADEFAHYQNMIRSNQGNNVAYPQGAEDTDWQDQIYRDGSTQNHQLSFSGGSEKINFYASGTYYDQKGILINSGYSKFSFLTNVDANVTDNLKLGISLTGGQSTKNGVETQSAGDVTVGNDDVVSLAMRMAPDKGIYNEDGTFTTNDAVGDELDNPYAVASQRDDETIINDFRANAYLDWEFFKGLSFKTTLGLSTENETQGVYMPSTLKVTASGVGGRAEVYEDQYLDVLSESYLTFNKEIGKGSLILLGGYSYQKKTDEGFATAGTGFISDEFSYRALNTATGLLQPDSYLEVVEIQSLFARANYDYADKYLLTATVRRDGASNFAENHKYATFPSAAVGWKISNESFMQDLDVVSNLKLRASYGVTGNPSIEPYQSLAKFQSIYASANGQTVDAITPEQPENPDLKWESSYQSNIGLDLGLWFGRVNLSLDYYNIDTKDLILGNNGIPEYLGYSNLEILTNLGEINNKGFEISIHTKNILKTNFRWTTDLNWSTNKNTVTALVNDADYFGDAAPDYFSVDRSYVLRVGEEVGLFWGYDYAGVYQGGEFPAGTATLEGGVAGDPLFRDIPDAEGNVDGAITEDDRTTIGNPNPDFTWGMTNDFTYKNFDLSIFIQGSQGGEIFNMTAVQLNNGDANTTKDYYNSAWTAANPNTDQPRVGNNSFREISSRFVEDGSYVRMKNIALGYTLPTELVEKVGIERLRLSVSAQNLWTLTKYSGLDPEASFFGDIENENTASNTARGHDFGNYPTVRSVSFSLNLTF